jgi:hypothetical protein
VDLEGVPEDPTELRDVPGAHREHQVGLFEHLFAHLSRAVALKVDPYLL